MRFKKLFLTNICLLVVALIVALNMPIQTATADTTTTVGNGTAASCTEDALTTALTVGGQINFKCGADPIFINVQAEKDIMKATTLDGGALITISGMNATRIFKVSTGAALDLHKLTLAYGAANDSPGTRDGDGGAILNDGGTLTLTDSSILQSRADHRGGAIYNRSGVLTLLRTTLARNNAGDYGSGLFNETGTVQLLNTTLSTNFAGKSGGGLYNLAGNISMINVTLYDNNAGLDGNAVGIGPKGNTMVQNTIIARTSDATINLHSVNCLGSLNDNGNNLQFPDNSCGEKITVIEPKLDRLADYGNYAETHALKTGSPAIDAGNQAACDVDPVAKLDERNGKRTIGKACDIGAFEYDPTHNAPTLINLTTLVTGTSVCSCSTPSCPNGQFFNPLTSKCEPPPPTRCPPSQIFNRRTGKCEPPPATSCPSGQQVNATTGKCEPIPTTPCPPGQQMNPLTGKCEPIPTTCPPGQQMNPLTGKCEPIPTTCPPPLVLDPATGRCVRPSTKPTSTLIPIIIPIIPIVPIIPICPAGETYNIRSHTCSCPPGEYYNSTAKTCMELIK